MNRTRQRQRREAAKIFLSNPCVLVSIRILSLYYLLLVRRTSEPSNVSFENRIQAMIPKLVATSWRNREKRANEVSHGESTTAQTSTPFHIVCLNSLLFLFELPAVLGWDVKPLTTNPVGGTLKNSHASEKSRGISQRCWWSVLYQMP